MGYKGLSAIVGYGKSFLSPAFRAKLAFHLEEDTFFL